MVYVYGSIFTQANEIGDFSWMIKQKEYSNVLFIFNDNLQDFLSKSCQAGGGNAIIRPYQCLNPPRSIGIPTGTTEGFSSLNQEIEGKTVKEYINDAFLQIEYIIKKNNYGNIIYSSDIEGKLGFGIFRPSDDVIKYITEKLQTMGSNIPQPQILKENSPLLKSSINIDENNTNKTLNVSNNKNDKIKDNDSDKNKIEDDVKNNDDENNDEDEDNDETEDETDDENELKDNKKSNFKFYLMLFGIIVLIILFFIIMKYFSNKK